MKTLEEGWQSFRKAVLPTSVDERQLRERRYMFFSGAVWLFELQRRAGDKLPELNMWIDAELGEFHAEIIKRGVSNG